jgi:hypothetical protein
MQVNSKWSLSNSQPSWDTCCDSELHHMSHVYFSVFIRGVTCLSRGFWACLLAGGAASPPCRRND